MSFMEDDINICLLMILTFETPGVKFENWSDDWQGWDSVANFADSLTSSNMVSKLEHQVTAAALQDDSSWFHSSLDFVNCLSH